MQNIFMLLIVAADCSTDSVCSNVPQARTPERRAALVAQPPKGEQGDFTICKDGRVLVFTTSHPLKCA